MRWTVSEVAEATGGLVLDPAGGTSPAGLGDVSGFSIDTRSLARGEMFVAVAAERDGHDFLAAAVAAGASAVLIEDGRGIRPEVPAVAVDDSRLAMLDIGRAARRRLRGPVVGITGSVGKTSTKDLAAAAMAAGHRTVASPRSFNNELGVPLTLANAPADAEAAVLEMGARGPGHIALLCDVAGPTIGIVTAVAAAHTEMFGDLDGVARAKGELVEALPPGGTAVLNGDDPRVRAMAARTPAAVLFYSVAGGPGPADVVAEGITLDGGLRPSFRCSTPWGRAEVHLGARGAHQVGNALAALGAAAAAGVDLTAAAAALAGAALSPNRMDLRRGRSGTLILDDSYNANPASMAAALRALHELPAARKVAVVGLMAELGGRSGEEHRAIAELADELQIALLPVGTGEYGRPPVAADGSAPELDRQLADWLGEDAAILVKASRVAALDTLAARLAER